MSSAYLLLPLLIIRYPFLALLHKKALARAAFFPAREGIETLMYWVYQASTLLMVVYLFFLKIQTSRLWLAVGLPVYGLGVLLLVLSALGFSRAREDGFSQTGLYRFSRNPMYVAYFVYFLGCALLSRSLLFFVLLCVFQLSCHWIILSEERWCRQRYGEAYLLYCQKVRRYC